MTLPLLNCEIDGGPNGHPTLVLVHGVAGSLPIWDPIFNDLAKTHHVVRLDLLGYGHSPKPHITYTPQAHVEAIRRTLIQRDIKPPYVLIGLSMGSTLVLDFAARYPHEVASLIAIGYPYYRDRRDAEKGLGSNLWAGLTIKHPLTARVFIPTVWMLGRIGILPSGLFTKIYSPVMASDTLLNPYRVFRSNIWHCMVEVHSRHLLHASQDKPRLFIHGERDMWSDVSIVRDAVSVFKASRFEIITNAEHNLVVLEPKRTLQLILGFIDAV
jgi:pimeloyl-ACP methyl ester carboxylesterase